MSTPIVSPDDFFYEYAPEAVAHQPADPRDSARLLVLEREKISITHHHFFELDQLLLPGDVIVRNNTKVLPARLFGKKETGGRCEVLLVQSLLSRSPTPSSKDCATWECLVKPGLSVGQRILFDEDLEGVCTDLGSTEGYTRIITFSLSPDAFAVKLSTIGQTPLPPYITAQVDEAQTRAQYQTTFAQELGSVAAPTAGLHFTPELDDRLRARGIEIHEVTLHVGLGTFLPVQTAQIEKKELHPEVFELREETAAALRAAKTQQRRIIAVGTTTTRVLESCVRNGELVAQTGTTRLFIQPGDRFHVVDGLITNFHVPRSSLLMLVTACTTTPNTSHPYTTFLESPVGQAYQAALMNSYRLFSYGDAMLIV